MGTVAAASLVTCTEARHTPPLASDMLKKIKVEQLTIGMHLKEFCGSWMEHPFWRTGFVLTDPKDIKTILASSIKEVWIDNSKGLDISEGEVAVTEAESDAQVEEEIQLAAQVRRVA